MSSGKDNLNPKIEVDPIEFDLNETNKEEERHKSSREYPMEDQIDVRKELVNSDLGSKKKNKEGETSI